MDYFTWIIIPGLIFLAEVLHVSTGTLRVMLVSKGFRKFAPMLGFVEVSLWLIAITNIIGNLNNPITFIAYASGFAAGIYAGMFVEERLAMGTSLIQIITRENPAGLARYLKDEGYTITSIKSEDEQGPIHVLLSIVKRKKLARMAFAIKQFSPRAFYTIEDIQYVSQLAEPLKPEAENRIKSSIRKFREKSRSRTKKMAEDAKNVRISTRVNKSFKKILKRNRGGA